MFSPSSLAKMAMKSFVEKLMDYKSKSCAIHSYSPLKPLSVNSMRGEKKGIIWYTQGSGKIVLTYVFWPTWVSPQRYQDRANVTLLIVDEDKAKKNPDSKAISSKPLHERQHILNICYAVRG
ncbi:hypothetical protein [Zooshikella harenae]|uniref:Uncharacterized protein n=1 Tax=Zooshikella harenae TaxID=2827238 RepID=A0ABS5ZJH5_9GAMM|nr:hypothetical protein [Zooshikella harenae]MBU2714232.1 hypothetical protein [Zooshikella harenae]